MQPTIAHPTKPNSSFSMLTIAKIGYTKAMMQQRTFLNPGLSSQSLPSTKTATKPITTHQNQCINLPRLFDVSSIPQSKCIFKHICNVLKGKVAHLWTMSVSCQKVNNLLYCFALYLYTNKLLYGIMLFGRTCIVANLPTKHTKVLQ